MPIRLRQWVGCCVIGLGCFPTLRHLGDLLATGKICYLFHKGADGDELLERFAGSSIARAFGKLVSVLVKRAHLGDLTTLAAVMIVEELLVIRKINLLGTRSMVSSLTEICFA